MKKYNPQGWKTSHRLTRIALAVAMPLVTAQTVAAQGIVPGTGQKVEVAGDDFEDPAWAYIPNLPKSSRNVDKNERFPTGFSQNRRWFEGAKRGQPDVVRRVETPEGGIPGSTGSLLMHSLFTGRPNAPSHQMQQDDFLFKVNSQLGYSIPVSRSPNVVVRVLLPPFEEWEPKTGASFGFRASVTAPSQKPRRRRGLAGLFSSRPRNKNEAYYPGMFIQFNSKADSQNETDSAAFIIRGNDQGGDFMGPQITETGWWTLGMSFTPDGRVHYYAHPGVEDLTQADHIASHFSQGVRCQVFNTYFFNVVNRDDGRTWSTPWIIDDPALYWLHGNRDASLGPRMRR